MNTKNSICFIVALAISSLFSSCYKDLGNYDYIDNNKILQISDIAAQTTRTVVLGQEVRAVSYTHLSWGFISAVGHNYEVTTSVLTTNLYYAANFAWDNSYVESITDNIWSKAYNIIANCNNIIQMVEEQDTMFFKEKALEKTLIDVYKRQTPRCDDTYFVYRVRNAGD